ncbi:MAG TPA: hypothetical protein VIV61_08685, partial [Candidatus Ozemobacteraceae bacterium]
MNIFQRHTLLSALVALILSPAALTAVVPPAPESATPVVSTVPAAASARETDPLASIGELIGEVGPMRKVALAFKVSGRIDRVPLFAGDFASAAAPIATL